MISVEPKDLEHPQIGKYLLGGVQPRPIAFVGTISEDGTNNLSPFSFFNAFGTNPPVVAFSPSRRGRDNTVKDTYNNLKNTGECTVQIVTYSMVEQMNLASSEYESDVDEFEKGGFTALDSDLVKAKRVAESPFQMECKLIDIVELGGKAGSGNLCICEVIKFHIAEDILDENKIPDPRKFDAVGRNGGAWYTRASGHAVFEIPKPGAVKGIGFPEIPDYLKNNYLLSNNNLARLALVDKKPGKQEAIDYVKNKLPKEGSVELIERLQRSGDFEQMLQIARHLEENEHPKSEFSYLLAMRTAIENDEREIAWKIGIYCENKFKK